MFKRADGNANVEITFEFEGQTVTARRGDSIAAALLAADEIVFRSTSERRRPRGPFCMMGICFDCLVIINGEPNQQACQARAVNGMSVRRQIGAATLSADEEGANDG